MYINIHAYTRYLRGDIRLTISIIKREGEEVMGYYLIGFLVVILSLGNVIEEANGEIPRTTLGKIERVNRKGPYLGIVAPNNYELNPLLNSHAYVPSSSLPFIDFAG